MGFPVRVIEMSERNRLPVTLRATLRADRAANRGETMVAIIQIAWEDAAVPRNWPWIVSSSQQQCLVMLAKVEPRGTLFPDHVMGQ